MILRLAALVAFIIAAVICLIVDAPDVLDILAALSIGLACLAAAPFEDGYRGRP